MARPSDNCLECVLTADLGALGSMNSGIELSLDSRPTHIWVSKTGILAFPFWRGQSHVKFRHLKMEVDILANSSMVLASGSLVSVLWVSSDQIKTLCSKDQLHPLGIVLVAVNTLSTYFQILRMSSLLTLVGFEVLGVWLSSAVANISFNHYLYS